MRLNGQFIIKAILMPGLMCVGLSAFAQEKAQDKTVKTERHVVIVRDGEVIEQSGIDRPLPPLPPMPPPAMAGQDFTFNFISSELSFDKKVVKGAPYSAEALTETVQTLGDGNRIVRKSSAKMYRDGEGRTRREQTLSAIGPFANGGEPSQVVFINDPVAGVSYSLDPRSRVARKNTMHLPGRPGNVVYGPQIAPGVVPVPNGPGAPVVAPQVGVRREVMVYENGTARAGVEGAPNVDVRIAVPPGETRRLPQPKTESLGKQTIEGVEAEGTRTTVTIPAGEIGNERPIEIVSERWYSNELQTVLMSKRNDPLAGETTYRLTNINRGEPAHTLFEVPADYKVKDGPPMFEFHLSDRKPGEDK